MSNKMGPYMNNLKQPINLKYLRHLCDAKESLAKYLYNNPPNWKLGELETLEEALKLMTDRIRNG